jgi:protein SCO1/2
MLFVALLGVWLWAALSLGAASAHELHGVSSAEPLPQIRTAPNFSLMSQDGVTVTLESLRGKVLAITFIYTACPDVCPVLTALMAHVKDELGADFGRRIGFVSITVDPQHDTPEVLKKYAEGFAGDVAGWAFLTGGRAAIDDITRAYGVAVFRTTERIDHTLLTSLVDRNGMLRVQYMGTSFNPAEFQQDLLKLVHEP